MVTFANVDGGKPVTTTRKTTTTTVKVKGQNAGSTQKMSTEDEARLKSLETSNDFLKKVIATTTNEGTKAQLQEQVKQNNEEIKHIKAKYNLASADLPPAPEGCKDLYMA